MALPKRRHSPTRRDLRRTHDKLTKPNFGVCPQCGHPKMAHRICSQCGYYKGKAVLVIKPKGKKEK